MGSAALLLAITIIAALGATVAAAGAAYRAMARAAVRPVYLLRRQMMWRTAGAWA